MVRARYSKLDRERWAEATDPEDYRRPFARDYDRLIHRPAFRRLQGKTQVVTPGQADFFRTRLTHTLEVAQISRRLAETLGSDPDATEASAILHDLGQPPFGHVGDEALCDAIDRIARSWGLKSSPETPPQDAFDEVGGFEGNAQSFRLATHSLQRRPGKPGLNLTRTVLDGAIKYPWFRDQEGIKNSGKKWCFFPTEVGAAQWVRDSVPDDRSHSKSLEAQIVEWADDLVYAIHDLEDWFKAGLMPLELLRSSEDARAELKGRLVLQEWAPEEPRSDDKLNAGPEDDPYTAAEIRTAVDDLFRRGAGMGALPSPFQLIRKPFDGSHQSKAGVAFMRTRLFNLFVTETSCSDRPLSRRPPKRHYNDLAISREARRTNDILRKMLWIYVIDRPRMATQQAGQKRVVETLTEIYCAAAKLGPRGAEGVNLFPHDAKEQLKRDDLPRPERLRLVADHIAGMTDSYAMRMYGRLTGGDPGQFIDFV